MGLTKQYLRYANQAVFNIIGSGRGGTVYVDSQCERAAVGAAQDVIIWDLRTKEKIRALKGGKHEVTYLTGNTDDSLLAAGYNDGSIRLFDTATGDCEITFTGHKTAITSLAFDKRGLRLVSGSRDTNIVVWDIVAETGLYRLHGHKGPVTAVRFIESQNVVVSASKDTFVKFWDLSNQHCFKTLAGHVTEVWDLVLLRGDSLLLTGGADMELRVWKLDFQSSATSREEGEEIDAKPNLLLREPELKRDRPDPASQDGQTEAKEPDLNDDNSALKVTRVGSILRSGEGRLVSLVVDPRGRLLACHGTDNTLELFVVSSDKEIQRRLARKAKREKKRTGAELEAADMVATVQEQFRRLKAVRAGGKIKSISVRHVKKASFRVLLALGNNQLEIVGVNLSDGEGTEGDETAELLGRLDTFGHRSDVRTTAFSSDNTALLTASSESLKIWNRASQMSVRTMSCGYALCSMFLPGDRHAVIGTKSGKLQIFDISSGGMTEEVAAHEGEIWSLAPTSDRRGLVTGSTDKTAKFWDFELIAGPDESGKILSLVHKRTLQLDEGVTCVSLSQDGRLIAVALLDSTVKVFFVDTLKFFLSLYGHKLPVVAMDISSDSTLIATGSADRNIKFWGLDFGDCHRSLFAHDDTVTGLRFVPNTHMVFTCGKDGQVKQWDADIFLRIITLSGHLGEVWCLSVSPNGKWVVTAGKDRTVRLWEKTSEIVVLDDERETEREEAAEEVVGETPPVPGEQGKETSLPSRRTAETERGAERLMEAIQLFKECEHEKGAQLPALMVAYGAESPMDFICSTVAKIKSAELEETLLVLPLDVVKDLLEILVKLLEAGMEVEIISRCIIFLLEIHHGPILANQVFEDVVLVLHQKLTAEVEHMRDIAGTNLAGLRYLADRLADRRDVQLFADATLRVREKNKKKKKKERALQRAIMSL